MKIRYRQNVRCRKKSFTQWRESDQQYHLP